MSFQLPHLKRAAVAPEPGLDLAAGFGSILAQHHVLRGGSTDQVRVLTEVGRLLSEWSGQGHSCLPVAEITRLLKAEPSEDASADLASEEGSHAELIETIRASPAIGQNHADALVAPEHLVVDDLERLYLQRYWRYEVLLATRIEALDVDLPAADDAHIRDALFSQFAPSAAIDWQMVAAATALTRRLTIITGGPGTGKTHTVARLLAALLQLAPASRIALAAPTGKAALRLEQLLGSQMTALAASGVATTQDRQSGQLTSLKAVTVHRLLGGRPGASQPRYHADAPLPFDVVVVDEASMLDLAQATKLTSAIAHGTRLILLGDADQLASVETGAVFAELASLEGRDEATIERLASICQFPVATLGSLGPSGSGILGSAVVRLQKSFRYQDAGGIGLVAEAVRQSNAARVEALLATEAGAVRFHLLDGALDAESLATRLLPGFSSLIEAVRNGLPAAEILATLSRYAVLCGLRRGPFGALKMNQLLARLIAYDLGEERRDVWFAGRVVMVTSNDPLLRLYNGDVGITLLTPVGLMIHFAAEEGVRAITPGRLPNCETAFAMTVHKSQGSEFDAVDIILPPAASPLNSRELLYTAITRARRQAVLWGAASALTQAVASSTVRYSALAERITNSKR